MGMLINLSLLTSGVIVKFGLLYVVFAIVGKIIGCSLPALFVNFNLRGALRIGVGMVPRGEVALIVAGIGLSKGVINDQAFSLAIIMTFITTLVTPPIFDKLISVDKPVLRKKQQAKTEQKVIKYDMPNPDTSELILSKVISAFEDEGFYAHKMKVPYRLYNIRKDESFITLKADHEALEFQCLVKDASFVHTLIYEVMAELEHIMKNLQSLTNKDKIGRDIFDSYEVNINENKKIPPSFQILNSSSVEVCLKANQKDEILQELVDLAIKSYQLPQEKREMVLSDLRERESTVSTGMQDNIALPHAKTDNVDKLICVVGLKKEGVDFESLDRQLSKIFVMTLTPKDQAQSYLKCIAEASRFLSDENMRSKILMCNNNEELVKIFKG